MGMLSGNTGGGMLGHMAPKSGWSVKYYHNQAFTVAGGGTSVLNGATNDLALLAYLQRRHPGENIQIQEVCWS